MARTPGRPVSSATKRCQSASGRSVILPRGPMASMRSPARARRDPVRPRTRTVQGDVDRHRLCAGIEAPDGVATVHHPVRRPAARAASGPDPARSGSPSRPGAVSTTRRKEGRQRLPADHLELPQRGVSQRPAGRPPSPAFDQVPCPGGLPGITPGSSPASGGVTDDDVHAGEVLEAGKRAARVPVPLGDDTHRGKPGARIGKGVAPLDARPAPPGRRAAASAKRPDPSKPHSIATTTPVPAGPRRSHGRSPRRPTGGHGPLTVVHRERDHGLHAAARRGAAGTTTCPSTTS